MANYVGIARTNYFHVKDLAAFKAALVPISVEIVGKGHESEPQEGEPIALLVNGGGWPSEYLDDDDEIVEVDFARVIAEHLVDGDVAVGMEIGFEKMRYLVGYGWAINSKGESVQVDLQDAILTQARTLGSHVTDPSY